MTQDDKSPTREDVLAATKGVRPHEIFDANVELWDTYYPYAQVMQLVLGYTGSKFSQSESLDLLSALGFVCRAGGRIWNTRAATAFRQQLPKRVSPVHGSQPNDRRACPMTQDDESPTREDVLAATKGVRPHEIFGANVELWDTYYPYAQVMRLVLGDTGSKFSQSESLDLLSALGFVCRAGGRIWNT